MASAGPPTPPIPPAAANLRIYNKVYNSIIGSADKYVPAKLRPLWVHPAGPKTIFFWAPVFKWVSK